MPLLKSLNASDDEHRVNGMASCEERDLQNEIIFQKGIDCQPAIERGWVNWDHGRGPEDQIGIPVVLEISRIEDHPVMRKARRQDGSQLTGWGLYSEAILLKGHRRAEETWSLLKATADMGEMRRLSWSIQGRAVERDPLMRSVPKSELFHVAITHQPVQINSFAQVAKSLSALYKGDDGFMSTDSAKPLLLENLGGGRMTEVLWGECQGRPRHYDGNGVFKGRLAMLEHLHECHGMSLNKSAKLVSALTRGLSR